MHNAFQNQEILCEISRRLSRNGYNALDQITGYLITGDPTYITSKDGARKLVLGLDRDLLLAEIVECYFARYGVQ